MANQTPKIAPELILAERKRREANKFVLEKHLFKEQLDFVLDPHPFATACCSRRSGKTIACAVDLVSTALARPGVVCLYITLSRSSAKKLIWPEILNLNRQYSLGGTPNIADLSLTLPNGSVIYCSGAKDRASIERFRGLALALVYIDEAQSFGPYLEELIDDVLSKALYDYDGRLRLCGTPGPIPAGYFYDACHSEHWSHHVWTMFENPWLEKKSGKKPQELMERDLKRKGVTAEDPSIQRECFGRWIVDLNSLVYRYSKQKNDYDELPLTTSPWQYVIGVDLGYDDADAIAIVGWNEELPGAYLIEEKIDKKQGITELAVHLHKFIARYKPISIVMDTGGLGKKIAIEVNKRHGLSVKPAEKVRKFEFIELLNDALRTQRFFAKADSQFAHDTSLVEWDSSRKHDKPKISDRFHTDIGDAVLYAYREALHFLFEPKKVVIAPGSPEWFQREVERMEEERLILYRRENDPDYFDPDTI